MRVTVLLFAALKEVAGRDRLELDFDGAATLRDVRERVVAQWPAAAHVPFVFAVNRDYAKEDRALREGDEVALVPAISGG